MWSSSQSKTKTMLRLWKETVLSPHRFQSCIVSVSLSSLSFSSTIFLQKNHPQCCSMLAVPDTNIKEWPPEGLHNWIIIQNLSLQPSVSCWQDQEHLCFISFHWRSCKSFLVSTKESAYNISPTPSISYYKYIRRIRERKRVCSQLKVFGHVRSFLQSLCVNSTMMIFDQKKILGLAYLVESDIYMEHGCFG